MNPTTLSAVLVALIAVNGVSAACSYASAPWPNWNVRVYTGTGCSGQSYEYHGQAPGCNCFNIASPLNDNVNSFVFSATASRSVRFYQNAKCSGADLGYSEGNWIKSPTSSSGRGMSSFWVC